jgi:hypothetical protein
LVTRRTLAAPTLREKRGAFLKIVFMSVSLSKGAVSWDFGPYGNHTAGESMERNGVLGNTIMGILTSDTSNELVIFYNFYYA